MALRTPDRVRRSTGTVLIGVLVGGCVTVGALIGAGTNGAGERPAKNEASDLPLVSTTAQPVEPAAGSLARKPVPVPPQSAPGSVAPAHAPAKRRAKATPRRRAKSAPTDRARPVVAPARVPRPASPPPTVAPKPVPPPAAVAPKPKPKPKPAVKPQPKPKPKPPRRVEFDSSG